MHKSLPIFLKRSDPMAQNTLSRFLRGLWQVLVVALVNWMVYLMLAACQGV